jgi:hypothetical protein
LPSGGGVDVDEYAKPQLRMAVEGTPDPRFCGEVAFVNQDALFV